MRIFFVLICSLALACVAGAQQEQQGKKKEQKKGAQTGQVSQPGGKPTGAGKPTGTGKPTEVGKTKGTGKPTGVDKSAQVGQPTEVSKPGGKGKGKAPEAGTQAGVGKPTEVGKPAGKGKGKAPEAGTQAEVGKPAKGEKVTGAGKPAEVGTATTGGKTAATGKATTTGKYTAKTIPLANTKQPRPDVAPAVTFQQNRHIEGSQNWQGEQYTVFRNYHSEWHDQGWWNSHYGSNIVFMFGAPYFLNAGYWQPAWGYNANAYYAYDGPIYAYNNLPPDQVIANVQTALQEQGYYQGEIDGLLGPQTRAAIADYQRANGLAETAAIDQPTLESLGMA